MRIVFAREATLGMVARNTDADSAETADPTPAALRFLRWWQVWLTRLTQAARSLYRALKDGDLSHDRARVRYVGTLLAGVAALLLGALGGVALSTPDAPLAAAVAVAVMSVSWAAIRLLLMRLVTPAASTTTAAALWTAWSLGLLPWVIGVTPELRVLAWGLSGALTWLTLERMGTSRAHARRIVGIAWGIQAIVVAGSWFARNALMVALLSRG